MATAKRLIDANGLIGWLIKAGRYCKGLENSKPITKAIGTIINYVQGMQTVDAVEAEDMRAFAEDVACQFGYYCQNGGRLHITHGGLSTLEWAFDILGWDNPHPVPEFECEIDGCHEHATCGAPTKDGYKRVCGKHYREKAVRQ